MTKITERKKWINESKKRCKKLGLNPDALRITKSLSPSELIKRQSLNEALIKSALPYMKIYAETFKLCKSIIVLTDKNGYILKTLGPESMLKSRIKMGLGEGGSLREEDAGTNAVALAIRYIKPVYVEGKEYYLKIFQSGACFCAPILNNGELIGTVVIVHPQRKGHPYSFALVKMLANIIAQEYENFLASNFLIDLSKMFNLLLITTDFNGNIVWISEWSKKIMKLNSGDNITKNFDNDILRKNTIVNEVFYSERLSMDFLVLRKEFYNNFIFILEPINTIADTTKIPLHAPYTFNDIVGLEKIKLKARRLAAQDVNLLIIGESGTGKELLASAIHNASPRAKERFVVVNCAAIPETLFESELFGYKKGAFTGAGYDKEGKIEYANKGTLFLDEIAELPLDVQAKLLRVLEDRKVYPLGSNESRDVDVRFIFATNQNLEELVVKGNFRRDLYYRISSPAIKIPPLRERRDEIPALIEHLLIKTKKKYKSFVTGLTEEVKKTLMEYHFPGNVRELEKILEQAFLTCRNENIDLVDLGIKFAPAPSIEERVKKYKAKLIYECFVSNNRNIKKTCSDLKISRAQLYRYLKIASQNTDV
ncbi:MAG: sigma 54-interacting transcriptional regulator [candidate division WOR-3 bacterium]